MPRPTGIGYERTYLAAKESPRMAPFSNTGTCFCLRLQWFAILIRESTSLSKPYDDLRAPQARADLVTHHQSNYRYLAQGVAE